MEQIIIRIIELFQVGWIRRVFSRTVWTDVGVELFCLFLSYTNTVIVKPILTAITSNIKPAKLKYHVNPKYWHTSLTIIILSLEKGALFVCLFCCFTSQVNSYGHGGTVGSPNHFFFLGKLEQAINQYFVHILSIVTHNSPSLMIQRRIIVENISWLISTKVWDWAGIELTTPISAVRLASVARQVAKWLSGLVKLLYSIPFIQHYQIRMAGAKFWLNMGTAKNNS